MSSSPRIKNYGVMGWLVDNCGFAFRRFTSKIPCMVLGDISKDGVRFLDGYKVEFTSNKDEEINCTIHFRLFGSLGMKVYESLQFLAKDTETKGFFRASAISIPDIDFSILTDDWRKERCSEVFVDLLNQTKSKYNLENDHDFFLFLVNCFKHYYHFVTSYTDNLEIDAESLWNSPKSSSSYTRRKKEQFVKYAYLKKQYTNKKKGIPLDLHDNTTTEGKVIPEKELLLTKEYDEKQLKFMYKMAKKNYEMYDKTAGNNFYLVFNKFIHMSPIRYSLKQMNAEPLKTWMREHKHDVDHLMGGM